MFETRVSDYRDYIGSTEAELGYGKEVVSSKVVDYKTENGQHLGLFVAEPLKGRSGTIIMPAQHEYRNEPLVMRRAEIIASHTGNRVAVVEMPGTVGLVRPDSESENGFRVYASSDRIDGGSQTAGQLKAAFRGDFSEHSGLQLDATTSVLGVDEREPLTLFGESMGAITSIEMIRHIGERGLNLNAVILNEAVNLSGKKSLPWLLYVLGELGGTESVRRNEYFDENTVIGHPVGAFEQGSKEQKKLDSARKSLRQQGFGGIANGLGMRANSSAKLIDSLGRFGNNAPSILLSRGKDSTVSDQLDYEKLGTLLKQSGHDISAWDNEDVTEKQAIGHFYMMSLGRQAFWADHLSSFMNR